MSQENIDNVLHWKNLFVDVVQEHPVGQQGGVHRRQGQQLGPNKPTGKGFVNQKRKIEH